MSQEKPKRRNGAPPVPALLESKIAEFGDVEVSIISFRADKSPVLNLPVGQRLVIFCLDGMLRVEAGRDETIHQWGTVEVTRPGPITLCPLLFTREPGQWAGATVVLAQGPLVSDDSDDDER